MRSSTLIPKSCMILSCILFLSFNQLFSQIKKEKAISFLEILKSENKAPFAYSKGNFSVEDNGALNYEVPIVCVPGAAGLTPKLALTYNSNYGGGILGEGWSLAGLSLITRTNKTLVSDGVSGKLSFDKDDRLLLDGSRLIKVSDSGDDYFPTAANSEITYYTENNGFKRIKAFFVNNTVARFEVKTKEGLTYYYGAIGSSQQELKDANCLKVKNQSQIISWLLTRIEDYNNNTIDFEYDHDALKQSFIKPLLIKYTGRRGEPNSYFASVNFTYQSDKQFDKLRSTGNYKYINGEKITFNELLKSVRTEFKNPLNGVSGFNRIYNINYLPQDKITGKFYIADIQECVSGNNCVVTNFKWLKTTGQANTNSTPNFNDLDSVVSDNYDFMTGDFNGDGLMDQAAIKIENDKVLLSFSRNIKGAFQKDIQYKIDIKVSVKSKILLGDFNLDGTTDFAFCWITADKTNFQIIYNQPILTGVSILKPTIGFSGSKKSDDRVKFNDVSFSISDFNSDGLLDIYWYYYKDDLIKIYYCINQSDKFIFPSNLQSLSRMFTAESVKDTIPLNTPINLGDFDSDGTADLLFSWTDNTGWKTKLFLLDKNLAAKPSYQQPIKTDIFPEGTLNISTLKTKQIKVTIDSVEYQVDSLISVSTAPFQLFKDVNLPKTQTIHCIDINHDGNEDLVISDQNLQGWKIWVMIGMGNGTFEKPILNTVNTDKYDYPPTQTFGDLNGDGNLDLCLSYSNDKGWFYRPSYGNGFGNFSTNESEVKLSPQDFSKTVQQRTLGMFPIENFVGKHGEKCVIALNQINGGKPVPTEIVGNINKSLEYLIDKLWSNQFIPTPKFGNNDKDYFDDFTFKDTPKSVNDDDGNFKRIKKISLADNVQNLKITRLGEYTLDANCNIVQVSSERNVTVNYPEFLNVQFVDYWKPIIADLNGDGITDFAMTLGKQTQRYRSDLGGASWKTIVSINQTKRSGLIDSIILGNGALYEMEYKNTTEIGAFDTNKLPISYPNIPYNVPLNVVRTVVSPDGIGSKVSTTYSYKNPIIGITGRGFMGFEKSEINTPVAKQRTVKIKLIDLDFLKYGLLPQKTLEIYSNGKLLQKNNFENKLKKSTSANVVFNYIQTEFSQTFTPDDVLSGSSVAQFDYDDYGNLLTNVTTLADGQKNIIQNEYFDNMSQENELSEHESNMALWIIGRLKTSEIIKEKNGLPSIKRKSEFTYFPITGLLATERSLVGSPFESLRSYTYDKRGNKIISKMSVTSSPGKTISETWEYDDLYFNRFLTKKQDALGYTIKYQPHEIFGFNILTIDADGLIMRTDISPGYFDALGTKKRTYQIDGTSQSETNYRCSNCKVANAVYFKLNESSTSITPTITYFDILDRPIKTIHFNMNYERVAQVKIYNSIGALSKISNPYFEGLKEIYFIENVYDDFGRIEKTNYPDGNYLISRYTGLVQTQINAKGQQTSFTNDLLGRKISETNNRKHITTYEYDLDDHVISIKDVRGRVFTSGYNSYLGKLEHNFNPNINHSTSNVYNGWGQLSQTKYGVNGGNVTHYFYDELGRIKEKAERKSSYSKSANAPINLKEDIIIYEYISAKSSEKGKGKIKEIRVTGDARKIDKTFSYDSFGRLASKVFSFKNYDNSPKDRQSKRAWNLIVPKNNFVEIKYSYYEDGQLATIRTPNFRGFRYDKECLIKYNYENGYLKSVNSNDYNLWLLKATEADGSIAKVSFNQDNTFTEYKYNNANHNIESIHTYFKNIGNSIQEWQYRYDSLSNIKYRVDKTNSSHFGETFDYDDLNRIVNEKQNSKTISYRYDEGGNISYKSNKGFYREKDSFLDNEKKEVKLIINRDSLNSIKNDEGMSGDKDNIEYYYDLVGNRYKKEIDEKLIYTIEYNHFNKPASIIDAVSEKIQSFIYDDENNQQIILNGSSTTFYFDGIISLEIIEGKKEKDLKLKQQIFISVNGSTIATNNIDGQSKLDNYFFMHKDALGSVTALTTLAGIKFIKAYSIWGMKLNYATWQPTTEDSDKGFTGHQHWKDYGLINMGGRVFDPEIAQFLQVDPILNLEIPSLGLTAYSYCYNNPLFYTDPSGNSFFKKVFGGVTRGVLRSMISGVTSPLLVFSNYRNFIDRNAGTIVSIQGMAASIILTPFGVPPALTGFATGFASSFSQSYLNGGSFKHSFEAGMLSGTISGVSAGITAGIGEAFFGATANSPGMFNDYWGNHAGAAITHAAFQGTVNAAQGGNFRDGALAGLVSSASSVATGSITGSSYPARFTRTAIAATLGGTVSELGGGKFSNGAATAAIVHMYNGEHLFKSANEDDLSPFKFDLEFQMGSTLGDIEGVKYWPSMSISESGGFQGSVNTPYGEFSLSADYDKGTFKNYTASYGAAFSLGPIAGVKSGVNLGHKMGGYVQGNILSVGVSATASYNNGFLERAMSRFQQNIFNVYGVPQN